MPSRSVTLIDSNGLAQASGAAITANAPAAASTPAILGTLNNIGRWEELVLFLQASAGNTGGTVDYVLQRLVDGPGGSTWDDYLYFVQQGSATAVKIVAVLDADDDFSSYAADKADVSWVYHDFNADSTLVLASGERRPGPPGSALRLIARTGAGVSAAAAVTLTVTAFQRDP